MADPRFDCYLDITPAGIRMGAPIYGVAAIFFDPLGSEEIPDYDPANIAAVAGDHGHSMAFFATISTESNGGFGLTASVSERMAWDDLIDAELVEDLMGRRCPPPVQLDIAFLWLHRFMQSGPPTSRPLRIWMSRPEFYYPIAATAFARTRTLSAPWGNMPDLRSLFTLNGLAYGAGREWIEAAGRARPDPYHPLRACIEGGRQVQTAIRDLAEVGPVDKIAAE